VQRASWLYRRNQISIIARPMSRHDISPYLVHFTKPNGERNALDVLQVILNGSTLVGGTNAIRGNFRCVCFTEAPLKAVARALLNEHGYTRYSPFGVMLEKRYIYDLGGRPVIYGATEEYDLLPDSMKWRHVRFEPTAAAPVDFTWEREWRLRQDALAFDAVIASIVVPTAADAARLREAHLREQDVLVQRYSQIMEVEFAEQYREECPWRIFVLNE
jgi:hypothetical protein